MKSVLITGGRKRLGKAIADAFEEARWRVVRSSHITASGVDIPADLRSRAGAESLMRETQRLLGRTPDVLINNAALYVGTGTDEETRQVNFESPKLLARLMQGGIVVNICDKFAAKRHPGTAYAESKEALAEWSGKLGHITIKIGDIIDLAPETHHEKALEPAAERLTSIEIAKSIVAIVEEHKGIGDRPQGIQSSKN